MSYLQTFQVFPKVPEPLSFLETLARNLWWCYRLDAIELFRRIDPKIWEVSGRNPITFSTMIPQSRLDELSTDESYLAHLDRVRDLFERQVLSQGGKNSFPYSQAGAIGYFSMEFGIHESLPLFAGGLGVLAGDHLKASSDYELPLNGVGLLYQKGYFHQFLNHEGWQQEEYPVTDFYSLPMKRAVDINGNELSVTVDGPDGKIVAIVWQLAVGRANLYLLDASLPENPSEIREITSRLYAADAKIRLSQEVLLGIGGMRALNAMGQSPLVCHMNEGHCAFAGLERLYQVMQKYRVDLKTALEIVPRSTVFTTHTPVAAGHDEFPADMVWPCVAGYAEKLGVGVDEILSWGQAAGAGPGSPISMFVLALRMSQYCNGVSRLHGKTARRMWSNVWPGRPVEEIPIRYVTNGIHIPSWISIENSMLFERYLGPEWYLQTANPEAIKRINDIYDEELWRSHEMARSRLIRTCRALVSKQYGRRNAPKSLMKEAQSVLDQDVLTIAFARRFATYKRANLLLQDIKRFEAILASKDFPVQFIFAGKAHPRDTEGKELIKRLIQFANTSNIRHKIVFLEDYDINIARHLVQGADVWLNTPRRPFEACGTSGIKAAVNGVLNLSILDGWWCEGYTEERGWRIGDGETYEDYAYQDAVESQALYNILENDVIPCFYERADGDLPTRWVKMMKSSMIMGILDFCAQKMVSQYTSDFYIPAATRLGELIENDCAEAKRLHAVHQRISDSWRVIKIERPTRNTQGPFRVGESFKVDVLVSLGDLRPEDVIVELYYGNVKAIDDLDSPHTQEMTVKEERGNGVYEYECTIVCRLSGRFGFTARVIPMGDDLLKFSPGYITWSGN